MTSVWSCQLTKIMLKAEMFLALVPAGEMQRSGMGTFEMDEGSFREACQMKEYILFLISPGMARKWVLGSLDDTCESKGRPKKASARLGLLTAACSKFENCGKRIQCGFSRILYVNMV